MTGEPGDDALRVLRSRFSAVDALRTEPRRKPELAEYLDVSRSTVDRAMRELESTGLVAREDDGYVLTLFGRVLADCYEAFLGETDDVAAAGPLLETLPSDAPMSVDLLAGATVDRAVPPALHRPIGRFESLLRDADRMRLLSRTISQSTTPRLIRERVVEGGMVAELVVGSELGAYLREQRREPEGAMIETGRYRLLEVESVPYGLAIVDADETHAVAFVYGENNDLLGTITNDATAAVDWADRTYRRYRNAAEDVSDEFRD